MRLVLDTNTAVSGLLWGGPPGRLIDAAVAGQVQLFTSLPLLAELRSVLSRPKFSVRITERATHADALFEGYAALSWLIRMMTTSWALRSPLEQNISSLVIHTCSR